MKPFYINDYKKFIALYLSEKYNLKKYTIRSILSSELENDKNILKGLCTVIKSNQSLQITNSDTYNKNHSNYTGTDFYTLSDINNKELDNICSKEFNYSRNRENKLMIHLEEVDSLVYNNIRDSIFFYDDLNKLNQFIFLNKSDNDIIYDTVPMIIRLYVPKEYLIIYSDYIKNKNIIIKHPLIFNRHLVYEKLVGYEEDENFKNKIKLDTELYYSTNSEHVLSNNTVYSILLKMTFKEWSELLSYAKDNEIIYEHKILSTIEIMLKDYPQILNLLKGI